MKIAVIGLDTSHSVELPRRMQAASQISFSKPMFAVFVSLIVLSPKFRANFKTLIAHFAIVLKLLLYIRRHSSWPHFCSAAGSGSGKDSTISHRLQCNASHIFSSTSRLTFLSLVRLARVEGLMPVIRFRSAFFSFLSINRYQSFL